MSFFIPYHSRPRCLRHRWTFPFCYIKKKVYSVLFLLCGYFCVIVKMCINGTSSISVHGFNKRKRIVSYTLSLIWLIREAHFGGRERERGFLFFFFFSHIYVYCWRTPLSDLLFSRLSLAFSLLTLSVQGTVKLSKARGRIRLRHLPQYLSWGRHTRTYTYTLVHELHIPTPPAVVVFLF